MLIVNSAFKLHWQKPWMYWYFCESKLKLAYQYHSVYAIEYFAKALNEVKYKLWGETDGLYAEITSKYLQK